MRLLYYEEFNVNKKDLYVSIDNDGSLSDEEKREVYFAEIDNENAEQEWQEEQ